MDSFLSPEESAVRRKARECFRTRAGPAGPGDKDVPDLRRVLEKMGLSGVSESGVPDAPVLLSTALVIEELAWASPSLGGAFLAGWEDFGSRSQPARPAFASTAWSLGTAAALYEAALRAARERGFFASTLMDHHKTQLALAELLSSLESARLLVYRALELIDRGQEERGVTELDRARKVAARTREAAEALAGALLGGPGRESTAGERSRP